MLPEPITDNEYTENIPTDDETHTNSSTLAQDQANTNENIPISELKEESTTERSDEVNPMYGRTTTSSESNFIEYNPHNNEENDKVNGDSIQINIHLIEETENNRGKNIKKSLQLIIILLSISLKM